MTFDWMSLIFVFISILIITILVVVHEFGHFLSAKYFGFQTPVFGIGMPFGPGINLFKRWGTQFKFYFLLIGGFVSIPELGDESNQSELQSEYELKPLRKFPVWQRAIVASGGIIFNIIFAFLLTLVMTATIGLPQAVPSNKISAFSSDSSAARIAGLQVGDKVISVAGHNIHNGSELKSEIASHRNTEVDLLVERVGGELVHKQVKYEDSLGVLLDYDKRYRKFGFRPLTWIAESLNFTLGTFVSMLFSVLGILMALFNKILAMILPFVQPPMAELGQVKGIVGIVQLISQDIQSNGVMILEFAILLSLNLAVINLLPIPALDGGHLAFMLYEAVFGVKASEKIQSIAIQIGLLFLLSIMALTTFNDIKNWIFS